MAITKQASASLTAQNTFCTAIDVLGQAVFSVSGTWVATVTLQRSHDNEVTWMDVQDYTGNFEITLEDKVGSMYRVGVKTGNYTSGTVVIKQKAQ